MDVRRNLVPPTPPVRWKRWIVMGAVLACVAGVLVRNFIRTRQFRNAVPCKSNLKLLGTALEMYASDHDGLFPPTLARLTPDYLRRIPRCSSARTDNYAAGYAAYHEDGDPHGSSIQHVDRYTIVCTGRNHENVGQGDNYPQYTSGQGLIAE